ncbi:GTPase, G3E family [Burkholderiales bacterium 8X]|nr:GTPase, G3E family [Burkholderiales bacterium 8X]
MGTTARLPLTVIGGFLGAGKTTLVNHWLRKAKGQRIAVLVNDFGAINVDAELIAASSGDTIALTNGCVCCQIGDDLSRALISVLDSGVAFDAVVVEASGVSDPWRTAQLGLADPGLRLGSVIVLVDAGAALEHARDPLLADTLERQLRAADLIVLNKADRVAPEELERVQGWVAGVAGKTVAMTTSNAVVPMELLGDRIYEANAPLDRPPEHAHHEGHAHPEACNDPSHAHPPRHGEMFETWSCRPGRAFDDTELRAWMRDAPAGLLRLKGIVRARDGDWLELQFAGRHGSVRRASSAAGEASIVAIALRGQLPRAELVEAFEAIA